MSEIKEIYDANKWKKFHISIFVLILSIVFYAWFYYWDYSITNDNLKIENIIKEKNNQIDILKKDSSIVIKNLIDSNKTTLDKLSNYSKISRYYYYLNDLSNNYLIDFSWFSYIDWKILTSAYSKNWDSETDASYNYEKTVKFIRNYRNDINRLFELEFINRVENKTIDLQQFDISLTLREEALALNTKSSFENINRKNEVNKMQKKDSISSNWSNSNQKVLTWSIISQ